MAKALDENFTKTLIGWYRENRRDLPWRKDRDPYHVWVSEIMLQQTRVEAVRGYYLRFMEALPTIRDLAEADEETLLKLWQGLGYYNRVRNLQKAAQVVQQNPCAAFPHTVEGILALPGIGEYTAGAIASICFGLRTPAVDGNVLRVMARLRNDPRDIKSAATKREVAAFLADLYPASPNDAGITDIPGGWNTPGGRSIPDGPNTPKGRCTSDGLNSPGGRYNQDGSNTPDRGESGTSVCKEGVGLGGYGGLNDCGDFTQALIELGALVCVPNGAPQCQICPAAEFCQGREAGTALSLPVKSAKRPRRREERTVFILTCGDKVAVRKRPAGSLLANLYEFPGVGQPLTAAAAVSQAEAWGCRPLDLTRSAKYKHIFTHVEWDMTGYYITCAAEGSGLDQSDPGGGAAASQSCITEGSGTQLGPASLKEPAPDAGENAPASDGIGNAPATDGTGNTHASDGTGKTPESSTAPFRWVSREEMEEEIPLPSAFQYFWE